MSPVAVLGKNIWGGAWSLIIGRQQRLSEITIEPIKTLGMGPGQDLGGCAPWPQHRTTTECHRLPFCFCERTHVCGILCSLWIIPVFMLLFLQGLVNTSLAFIDLLITDKLKSAHFSYIWS